MTHLLQAAVHALSNVALLAFHAPSDLGNRQSMEVTQEHCRAVRLGQSNQSCSHLALSLQALDGLHRRGQGLFAGRRALMLSAPLVHTQLILRPVAGHPAEPSAQGSASFRRTPQGPQPGVLQHIIRIRILHE